MSLHCSITSSDISKVRYTRFTDYKEKIVVHEKLTKDYV